MQLDVKVENRKLEATVTFQVTNKAVNSVTAQYADKKTGPRLTAALKIMGDIDPATASISNFSVGLDVKKMLGFKGDTGLLLAGAGALPMLLNRP